MLDPLITEEHADDSYSKPTKFDVLCSQLKILNDKVESLFSIQITNFILISMMLTFTFLTIFEILLKWEPWFWRTDWFLWCLVFIYILPLFDVLPFLKLVSSMILLGYNIFMIVLGKVTPIFLAMGIIMLTPVQMMIQKTISGGRLLIFLIQFGSFFFATVNDTIFTYYWGKSIIGRVILLIVCSILLLVMMNAMVSLEITFLGVNLTYSHIAKAFFTIISPLIGILVNEYRLSVIDYTNN
jgi:hypothetical protein